MTKVGIPAKRWILARVMDPLRHNKLHNHLLKGTPETTPAETQNAVSLPLYYKSDVFLAPIQVDKRVSHKWTEVYLELGQTC